MLLVACVASVIGIPWLALTRHGYRGAYLAVALSGLALGAFAVVLTGPPTSDDEATRAGAEFLNAYAFSFAQWAFVTGFAAIVGACLYRPKEDD